MKISRYDCIFINDLEIGLSDKDAFRMHFILEISGEFALIAHTTSNIDYENKQIELNEKYSFININQDLFVAKIDYLLSEETRNNVAGAKDTLKREGLNLINEISENFSEIRQEFSNMKIDFEDDFISMDELKSIIKHKSDNIKQTW